MSLIVHPKYNKKKQIYRPANTSSWDDIIWDIKLSFMEDSVVQEFLDWISGPRWLITINSTNIKPLMSDNKKINFKFNLNLYTPIPLKLNYWFAKPKPIRTNTDYVLANQDIINNLTDLEKLRSISSEIQKEGGQWMRSSGFFLITFRTVFDQASDIINNRIMDLTLPMFNVDLEMSDTEIINGYALYNCKANIMTSDLYEQLKALLDDESPKLNYDEFIDSVEFCSDWNKCNLTNDISIDFEDDDWWYNTFEMNTRAVWNLPFHSKFLKETIDIGCSNRREGARYSNFLGVWVQRKTKQLNQLVKKEIRSLNRIEFNPLDNVIADYTLC